MNYSQTAEMLGVISTAYRWFEVDELKLRLWNGILKDIDFELVKKAVSEHIATSEKEPTVAGILKRIAKGCIQDQPTSAEAWGLVNKAIHKHGYNNPTEAMESFPPPVAKVVKAIGWMEICTSENLNVIRGQFLKMYEETINCELERLILPDNLKAINNIAINKMLQKQE